MSSSSDAIVTSSPSHDVAQTPVPKLKLSSKALGKQRATSPIADGDHDTPVPHRVRRPLALGERPERKRSPAPPAAAAADDDDDDDELLAPADMIRRADEKREKARRAQALQDKKRAALTAAKAAAVKAAQGDSDSDLEIEMPGAPSRAVRASSSQAEDTLAAFARTPARPKNDPRKVLARIAGVDLAHPPSDDALPSESQLDAAGHEFGRHLDTRYHENLASTRKKHLPSTILASSSTSRAKKSTRPVEITHEKLSAGLREKVQLQALLVRTKNATRARQREQNAAAQGDKQELQSVDVGALIKSKREKEEADEQDEQDEDGDYIEADEDEEGPGSAYAGSGSELDEAGSGADEPDPVAAAAADDDDAGEDDVDSDGELVMPRSSQNSERHLQATQEAAEEDEDEEMPPPTMARRSKIRVIADEDDDEQQRSTSDTPASTELAPTEVVKTPSVDAQASAPAKVGFGALLGDDGDAGGFSQFFDSQFSQGAGGDQVRPLSLSVSLIQLGLLLTPFDAPCRSRASSVPPTTTCRRRHRPCSPHSRSSAPPSALPTPLVSKLAAASTTSSRRRLESFLRRGSTSTTTGASHPPLVLASTVSHRN